jgi:hypothetical protein
MRDYISRNMPDTCDISNVPGDTSFDAKDVPCIIKAQSPRIAVTDDGTGGQIVHTLQRWNVSIVGGQDLPDGKARITAKVEGVDHIFETTTRVPRGQSLADIITLECEQVFGGS